VNVRASPPSLITDVVEHTCEKRSGYCIETARKLGVDETEAGHERAFGKVGMKKPKKTKRKKQEWSNG